MQFTNRQLLAPAAGLSVVAALSILRSRSDLPASITWPLSRLWKRVSDAERLFDEERRKRVALHAEKDGEGAPIERDVLVNAMGMEIDPATITPEMRAQLQSARKAQMTDEGEKAFGADYQALLDQDADVNTDGIRGLPIDINALFAFAIPQPVLEALETLFVDAAAA